MTNSTSITKDEAALYDRQIRLWGLESQKRLRNSKVLIVNIGGLSTEIAKNLVLAGVNTISILCDRVISRNHFLAPRSADTDAPSTDVQAFVHYCRHLNPFVHISVCERSLDCLDKSLISDFHVVVATGCSDTQLKTLGALCHGSTKFFAADVFGYYGVMFLDLGEHRYAVEHNATDKKQASTEIFVKTKTYPSFEESYIYGHVPKKKQSTMIFSIYQAFQRFHTIYSRFPCVESIDEDILRLVEIVDSIHTRTSSSSLKSSEKTSEADPRFSHVPTAMDFRFAFSEIVPCCAVLGGVLVQEVIKSVSEKDEPLDNWFLFNGRICDTLTFQIS